MENLDNRNSSIEVSRNAKGEYTWKIKIYFEEEGGFEIEILHKISDIDFDLRKRYIT